jgi:acid phosphatase family membrane protein YuiD
VPNFVSNTVGRTRIEGVLEQDAKKIFGHKRAEVTVVWKNGIIRSYIVVTLLHTSLW